MITRRYEGKYAYWPYKAWRLCSPAWNPGEKLQIAEELHRSPECCLDTFSNAFRKLFPTTQDMVGNAAQATLASAFHQLQLSTDFSERQNSEIQSSKPALGCAREFVHFSRAMVLTQAKVVHVTNGGSDPTRPASAMASLSECMTECNPFLAPTVSQPKTLMPIECRV